jgi:DNA-binding CsgD family transcriptional regulator
MSRRTIKPPLVVNLPECEHRYLALAAEGLTTKEIAREAGRSPETVKQALHNTRVRLSARDTTHAVAIAIRHGLIA